MVFALNTSKYAFRIRTRTGMVVENLTIHGREESDAQRKLGPDVPALPGPRMPAARAAPAKCDPASFEEVISLVTK